MRETYTGPLTGSRETPDVAVKSPIVSMVVMR